jgi:hypothetical protein
MVDKLCGETAWSRDALSSIRMLGKIWKWQAGNLQVVRNGNDGEKNQKEHSQGHKLHPRARSSTRSQPQPEAEHQGRKENPGEIEEQLHSQR